MTLISKSPFFIICMFTWVWDEDFFWPLIFSNSIKMSAQRNTQLKNWKFLHLDQEFSALPAAWWFNRENCWTVDPDLHFCSLSLMTELLFGDFWLGFRFWLNSRWTWWNSCPWNLFAASNFLIVAFVSGSIYPEMSAAVISHPQEKFWCKVITTDRTCLSKKNLLYDSFLFWSFLPPPLLPLIMTQKQEFTWDCYNMQNIQACNLDDSWC